MKPVTINITNLIGTMVIIGDKEISSEETTESVTNAILKVLARAQSLDSQELSQDKTSSQSKDQKNQD